MPRAQRPFGIVQLNADVTPRVRGLAIQIARRRGTTVAEYLTHLILKDARQTPNLEEELHVECRRCADRGSVGQDGAQPADVD